MTESAKSSKTSHGNHRSKNHDKPRHRHDRSNDRQKTAKDDDDSNNDDASRKKHGDRHSRSNRSASRHSSKGDDAEKEHEHSHARSRPSARSHKKREKRIDDAALTRNGVDKGDGDNDDNKKTDKKVTTNEKSGNDSDSNSGSGSGSCSDGNSSTGSGGSDNRSESERKRKAANKDGKEIVRDKKREKQISSASNREKDHSHPTPKNRDPDKHARFNDHDHYDHHRVDHDRKHKHKHFPDIDKNPNNAKQDAKYPDDHQRMHRDRDHDHDHGHIHHRERRHRDHHRHDNGDDVSAKNAQKASDKRATERKSRSDHRHPKSVSDKTEDEARDKGKLQSLDKRQAGSADTPSEIQGKTGPERLKSLQKMVDDAVKKTDTIVQNHHTQHQLPEGKTPALAEKNGAAPRKAMLVLTDEDNALERMRSSQRYAGENEDSASSNNNNNNSKKSDRKNKYDKDRNDTGNALPKEEKKKYQHHQEQQQQQRQRDQNQDQKQRQKQIDDTPNIKERRDKNHHEQTTAHVWPRERIHTETTGHTNDDSQERQRSYHNHHPQRRQPPDNHHVRAPKNDTTSQPPPLPKWRNAASDAKKDADSDDSADGDGFVVRDDVDVSDADRTVDGDDATFGARHNNQTTQTKRDANAKALASSKIRHNIMQPLVASPRQIHPASKSDRNHRRTHSHDANNDTIDDHYESAANVVESESDDNDWSDVRPAQGGKSTRKKKLKPDMRDANRYQSDFSGRDGVENNTRYGDYHKNSSSIKNNEYKTRNDDESDGNSDGNGGDNNYHDDNDDDNGMSNNIATQYYGGGNDDREDDNGRNDGSDVYGHAYDNNNNNNDNHAKIRHRHQNHSSDRHGDNDNNTRGRGRGCGNSHDHDVAHERFARNAKQSVATIQFDDSDYMGSDTEIPVDPAIIVLPDAKRAGCRVCLRNTGSEPNEIRGTIDTPTSRLALQPNETAVFVWDSEAWVVA